MAWIGAAISVVGGLLSNNSSKKAKKRAARAAASEQALAQEQYDDWKEVYGPIQDNLGEYYAGLTPDQYEVTGIQAIEEQKAAGLKQLNERLAQRGISDSSIAAAAEMNIELDTIQDKATVRATSEQAVAEQQMNFLQVGLGQDPGSDLLDTLRNNSNNERSYANQSERLAGESISNALTAVGTALSDND